MLQNFMRKEDCIYSFAIKYRNKSGNRDYYESNAFSDYTKCFDACIKGMSSANCNRAEIENVELSMMGDNSTNYFASKRKKDLHLSKICGTILIVTNNGCAYCRMKIRTKAFPCKNRHGKSTYVSRFETFQNGNYLTIK